MTDITAIIAAKGNPPHLIESLTSVEFCKERILLDIGLDNATKELLQHIPQLTIIPIPEKITYIEQIREQSKQYAHCDTIFFLDPDEIIPPQLAASIQTEYRTYDAIKIPRKNIICNKWIQHSRWWPDYQVRVFKKDKAFWPIQLHGQPKVEGNIITLPAEESLAIIHHNYESLDEYFAKMLRYGKSEAQEISREKRPYPLRTCISEALQEFMSRYFAAEGYRDGIHGFMLAFLQMMYKFIVYFYVWEISGYKDVEKNLPERADLFFKQGFEESSHWMIAKNLCSPARTLQRKIIRVFFHLLGGIQSKS